MISLYLEAGNFKLIKNVKTIYVLICWIRGTLMNLSAGIIFTGKAIMVKPGIQTYATIAPKKIALHVDQ